MISLRDLIHQALALVEAAWGCDHGWPWVAMAIADPKGFSDTWGGEDLKITLT